MKSPIRHMFGQRRSPSEWAARGGLVVIVALLGTTAISFTAAKIATKQNPAWAYRLSPGDGRVTAAYALALSGPEASESKPDFAKYLAEKALQQDPTASAAANALGLLAQRRGDRAAERRFFTYAQKLSRRDLATQLWSIEDAVNHNDIPGAITWYNNTLRTNPEMSRLLFPVLIEASNDAAIRHHLIKKIATRPQWSADFMQFVPNNATDPQTAVILFDEMQKKGVAVPPQATSSLIDRLLSIGNFDLAWQHYAQNRGAVDRKRSRYPNFAGQPANPSMLDWRTSASGGISALIEGNVLDFSAPAGVGGTVVRQVQLLAPGNYRLSGRSQAIDLPDAARPYWTLTCGLGQGLELGRVLLPAGTSIDGSFSGTLHVPRTCSVQTLTLVAQPVDTASGLSGRISQVQLRRE